ncbi:hypothetical protein FG386_003583 [Cryptosporidium ryanae]|uniref:uncharacterized protein n=1 Tax=Cryptosporidium ryanae TaxID=515981 RepID=UPI00351A3B19|nr:hypothetical protein FG386_003583 [Cryptosporidium ryanae]
MFKKKVPQTGGETILGRRSVIQLRDRIVKQYNLDSKVCDIILGRKKKKDLKIFSTKLENKEINRGILYRVEFENESNFYFDKTTQSTDGLECEKLPNETIETVSPAFDLDLKPNVSNITKYPAIIPWIFELGSGKVFPTLQLIWIYGSILRLPEIIVLDHVKSYIFNGADLMAGGILFYEINEIEEMKKDQIWIIRCKSDEHPIAIGISLVNWNEISTPELQKGKILKVIHHNNDALSLEGNFKFSFLRKGNEGSNSDSLDSVDVEKTSIRDITRNETEIKDQKEKTIIDVKKYDFLLELMLIQVLSGFKDSKSVLPLDSSAIWDRMSRLSLKIYGMQLDIKNSSYIKVSKFFQHYNKTGILTIKQNRMRIMSIVDIKIEKIIEQEKNNSTNNIFVEFELIRKMEAKTRLQEASFDVKNKSSENNQLMEIINVYQPDSNFQTIIDYYISNTEDECFGEIHLLKTSRGVKEQFFISILDAKKALEYYINSNNLRVCDPKLDCNRLTHVKLDEALESLISDKNTGVIRISQLFKSISNFLKPFHYIKNNSSNIDSNEKPNLIRGSCKPILIYTESRTGAKKFVTIISPYISHFSLDPQRVAESCQKRFACSAAASQIKGFPSDSNIGVVIQGNVTNQISEFLTIKWGIPKSVIQVL